MEQGKKVITKIEIQKRNKDRVNVYINEEFSFACSAELVYLYNICKGKEADFNELKGIIEEDNFIKCKSRALKIIERSYKTEKQIKDKLLDKEYEEKEINRTIAFLKEYKFLDDNKFAGAYVKEKIRSQGKKKIKFSLIKKGLSEDLIEEQLKMVNTEDEEITAKKLAEKKYNTIIKTEKDRFKIQKKLGDHLYRNGYSSELIKKILKEVIKDDSDEYSRKEEQETDIEELREIAEKRYNIIVKSESDKRKLYKKLGDYLMRRGYPWGDIKKVLNSVIES